METDVATVACYSNAGCEHRAIIIGDKVNVIGGWRTK